jgi:penicillin-binding protein 1A
MEDNGGDEVRVTTGRMRQTAARGAPHTSGWRVAPALLAAVALAGCSYTVELDPIAPNAESSTILAADGTRLVELDAEEDRRSVPFEAIAPVLRDAVVAIEDHRFWDHQGVDYRAVVRALRRNAAAGEVTEGGSTITQQYVRAVLTGRERTVSRKLREAALAIEIERRLSKEEILERYLNTIYFGNGAYGAETAADRFFAKPAADLTLAEGALLAGAIRAPETYNAFEHPDRAKARRDVVLDAMARHGFVTEAEAEAAQAEPVAVTDEHWTDTYPAAHFVERVKRFVLDDERFGATADERRRLLFQGGLRIETTLDVRQQAAAELAIAGVLTEPGDPQASLVALDPATGYVRAYVGGRDYFADADAAKFDLASQARRQSGSSFKPIVLAAAIEHGVPLAKTYDAPGELTLPQPGQEPWRVRNYDGEGEGQMDLVEATVFSVNTVYAQLITDIGAQRVVDLAARMGVRSPLAPYPSAALGTNGVSPLDMASAFATLAADGVHAPPTFVTKVTAADGTVLYEHTIERRRVMEAETARQVNAVLEQVVTRGTGVNARIGRPVAGKTGTGEEWRDAWFVGSTPELTAAVWVGFQAAEIPMVPPTTRVRVTGGLWPTQIWAAFAAAALAETPVSTFPPPGAAGTEELKTVIVPDVRGMPGDRARQLLERAGFVVETAEEPNREFPPGRVLRQDPPPRAALPAGTVVHLTLARVPKVVNVPSVLGLLADEAIVAGELSGLKVVVVREAEPGGSALLYPGRAWKQSVPAGTRVDEGTTLQVWVNPGLPPTTTTAPPPPPATTTTSPPPTTTTAPPVSTTTTTTP